MGGSRAALVFFLFTWRIRIGFMNLDRPSKQSKIQIKKEMKIENFFLKKIQQTCLFVFALQQHLTDKCTMVLLF